MADWAEIADGVWQARYQPLDVSVCLVRGPGGLLLVDTRCNPREAAEIVSDVRALAPRLGPGVIRWVANTHAHYDHTFGNQLFARSATIYGHRRIAAHFDEYEGPQLARWAAEAPQDWADVVLTPPHVTVDGTLELDLGGRTVRLITLPPGHTGTDMIVHVPDAGCWIVGDVVEESGPPQFGADSDPLGWPRALHALAGMIGENDRVVPGHGRVVGLAYVLAQSRLLGQSSATP